MTVAGSRNVRPRRRRSPAAEAFAQAAGGRRQQKRSPKAQAASRQQKRSPKAQAASRQQETVAQGAGGRRQVRKSTFRPNRTPRSPVSSLWTGGQRRAGCGICENAFSAPRPVQGQLTQGLYDQISFSRSCIDFHHHLYRYILESRSPFRTFIARH